MIKKATRAKVAVFTSALDAAQTETKGTVLIKNAEEMLNFTTGEEKHLEKAGSSSSARLFIAQRSLDFQRNRRFRSKSHYRRLKCWRASPPLP